MRKYFTLAVREDSVWGIAFGDYDRSVVAEEASSYRLPRRDRKILCTGETQAEIDAAIKDLNEGVLS